MEPMRDRITKSLREHSESAVFGQAPTRQIVAAGNRLRRRRTALVGAASVAAVVAIAGMGWAVGETQILGDGGDASPAGAPTSAAASPPSSDTTTEESRRSASASDSDGSATTAPPVGVELTPCGDLPRFDADPIDDYTIDAHNEILTFSFHTDSGVRTVNIAYGSDRACREHPDVNQVLTFLERLGSL